MNEAAFRPPPLAVPAREPSFLGFLRAVRSNALLMWPEDAYDAPHLASPFLGRTRLLLNEPDAVHHVLVANGGNYRRTRASIRILAPLTGKGLLLSEGEAWRLQRRTTAPALGPRALPVLLRHVAASCEAAVASLAAQTGPVDLLAAMQALALDIAGRSMFSIEMTAYRAPLRALLEEYAARHGRASLLDMLLPRAIPAPGDLGRRRFHRRWMGLIATILDARLAGTPPSGTAPARDLLDLLLAARDPVSGQGFAPEALRDQVATLLVAGHETTALALFWALYLLASDPATQETVSAEARGLDLGPDGVAEALPRLVCTRAVLSETLRLYPPAFTLVREAIAADVAAGTPIPAGAVVMIAPWVLHRHRRLWARPDLFDPERFMPGAPPPPRLAYLPFGAGPRICVGAQFALAEATVALASLVSAFRIGLAPGARPVRPVAIVTIQPDHAPGFALHSRTS